jgi:hypothetical protein
MLNLKHYRGFALRHQDFSQEAAAVRMMSAYYDFHVERFFVGCPVPDDLVPCGSVEWVSSLLPAQPEVNYYPNWVQPYLHRKVWKSSKWEMDRPLFVKPADAYKRFTGFVTTGGYSKKKKPPFIYSEVVTFVNEWRYYISNGEVLVSGWYDGDARSMPDAPPLPEIPNVTCAADFGTLPDGTLACVEVQHPYACGWYGKTNKDSLPYLQWVIDGWDYMKTLY